MDIADLEEGLLVRPIALIVEPRFMDTFYPDEVYVVCDEGRVDVDGEVRLEHPDLGGGEGFLRPEQFEPVHTDA